MSQRFRGKVWQVLLPDGWRASSGGDDVIKLVWLWNPEGVGQIRVLSRIEKEAPLLGDRGEDFHGNLRGQTHEHSGRTIFTRHWTLFCRNQRIHVTY